MKIFKRVLSLIMCSAFIVALSPSNAFNKIVNAKEEIPKYLTTSEGDIMHGYVYKDKVVASFYSDSPEVGSFYFDKGVKKKLTGEVGLRRNYKESEYSSNGGYFIFDIEKGQVAGIDGLPQKEELIKNKYGSGYTVMIPNCSVSKDYGSWYHYSASSSGISYEGIITPDDKIVEFENGEQYVNDTVDGGSYYVPIFKASSTDPSNGDDYLKVINKNGDVKRYDLDESIRGKYGIVNVKVSNNTIYLELVNYADNSDNYYYKMNISGDKLLKGEKLFDKLYDNLTQDYYGNFWRMENGYVYKFENNMWAEKYQVDPNMVTVEVYDDNNLLVTGAIKSENKHIYTIINNNADNSTPTAPSTPNEPQNPTNPSSGNGQAPGNNNGGSAGSNNGGSGTGTTPTAPQNPTAPAPTKTGSSVVVGTATNGVLPVAVSDIKKDEVNVVNVSNPGKANNVEVTIGDGKSIKEGKGSLQVNIGQQAQINLPFVSIDKSLLSDTAKVVLDATVEENADIVKGLKAVKKVYSFNLSVVDGDKKTAIHKFAYGSADITLTLSDDELKGLNKNNLQVFYYNEETKKFETMETKTDGNKVTFKTPHFSKFIIAEKTASSGEVLPQTGSYFGSLALMTIAGALIVLGVGVLSRRRLAKISKR